MKKNKHSDEIVYPTTGHTGVLNDSFTHANVKFPVPWTGRTSTPIRRVRHGNMWGGHGSDSYGGPQ